MKRILHTIDHEGMEGVARFKGAKAAKHASAFLCSHVECFRQGEGPVALRLVKAFQFGKLNGMGDLAIDRRMRSTADVAAHGDAYVLSHQRRCGHDAGNNVGGGLRAMHGHRIGLLCQGDIPLRGEDEMGKNSGPLPQQTAFFIYFCITAVIREQAHRLRGFPAGFHHVGMQAHMVFFRQLTKAAKQLS